MNLYACAGLSRKNDGMANLTAANCIANSEDEAIGKIYTYICDKYPSTDGYIFHSVTVTSVDMDKIEAVYLANHKEK